jgi:carbamoyl-phosphate synthase large subunit
MLDKLKIPQPPNGLATNEAEALVASKHLGYPVLVRPSFVLGGRAMQIVYSDAELSHYMKFAVEASPERPVLVDKFLEDATEVDVDCITDVGHFINPNEGTIVIGGMLEHIEFAGVHSGDAAMVLPPHTLSKNVIETIRTIHACDGARIESHRPDERAIRRQRRNRLCPRSEPARLAHRAVCFQGHWQTARQTRRKSHGGKNLEGTEFHGRNLAEVLGGEGIRFSVQQIRGPGHFALAGNAFDGEVMGLDADLGVAYAKSQMAANSPLPTSGKVFISVSDAHKKEVAAVAKSFSDLGFELVATSGTAAILEKPVEGSAHPETARRPAERD